jgi:hypothetical protein
LLQLTRWQNVNRGRGCGKAFWRRGAPRKSVCRSRPRNSPAPHKTYIAPPASARIVAGVQSANLTPEQAARIVAQVRPMLAYLRRLVKRMDKRRFPSDDPLFRVALNAHDAVHELHVHVHYLSCPSGVRQLPPEQNTD